MNTERLSRWLKQRGMSHNALAAAIGVTPAAISQFYHGVREPSRETLMKIAALTGIRIEGLVRSAGDRRDE